MKKGLVFTLLLISSILLLQFISAAGIPAYPHKQEIYSTDRFWATPVAQIPSDELSREITFTAYPGEKVLIYSQTPGGEYGWGNSEVGTCEETVKPGSLFADSEIRITDPSTGMRKSFSAGGSNDATGAYINTEGHSNYDNPTHDNRCSYWFYTFDTMDITSLFSSDLNEDGTLKEEITKNLVASLMPNGEGNAGYSRISIEGIGSKIRLDVVDANTGTSTGETVCTSSAGGITSENAGEYFPSDDKCYYVSSDSCAESATPAEVTPEAQPNTDKEVCSCKPGAYSMGRYVVTTWVLGDPRINIQMAMTLLVDDKDMEKNGKVIFEGKASLLDLSDLVLAGVKGKEQKLYGLLFLTNIEGKKEDFFEKSMKRVLDPVVVDKGLILDTGNFKKTFGTINFNSATKEGSKENSPWMIYLSGSSYLQQRKDGDKKDISIDYSDKTNPQNIMGPFNLKNAAEYSKVLKELITKVSTEGIELNKNWDSKIGKPWVIEDSNGKGSNYLGKNQESGDNVELKAYDNGIIIFSESNSKSKKIVEYYPPTPEKDTEKLIKCVEFYKKKAAAKAGTQPATQPAQKAASAIDPDLYLALQQKDPTLQLTSTRSFSVFMLRNNSNYSGIAYHLAPQYLFNQDVALIFNDSSGAISHFDDSLLNNCEYSILNSSSSVVGISGGVLGLKGKVLSIFPIGAVTTGFVNFTIDEINISSCNHCTNNLQDSDETGIDCGGETCSPCEYSCFDGIQDGDETGIDCGGNCTNNLNESYTCGIDVNRDCQITECNASCSSASDCTMCAGSSASCTDNECICGDPNEDIYSVFSKWKTHQMSLGNTMSYLDSQLDIAKFNFF